MTTTTGQVLRRLGLTLEAISMLGILSMRRGDVGVWKGSGLDPNVVLPALFVIGLAMWLTGTVVIQRNRKRP